MVQFNELRVGNLVHVGNGIYERVLEILCDSITTETKQGIFDFEGIPLTPEILEKAGFILRGFYYHFPNHDIFKLEQYKLKNSYWLRHNTQSIDSVRINYLHQLQNLYFSLTGEELQIEL